ncbi:MAG TPA: alpha/beta hydrolase, partial [Allocoleopsis sp.]
MSCPKFRSDRLFPLVNLPRWCKPDGGRIVLKWKGIVGSVSLLLATGIASPTQAAERLEVRLGPVEQSIEVADLEQFVVTGKVPDNLRLYAPLFTPEARQALGSRLRLDPGVGDKLVEDLLHSSAGERFLNTMQVAKQPEGISLLGLLKAFPEQTVTVDAVAALALVSQMNLPSWQSQTLSSILDRELTVKGNPIQSKLDPTESGPYWVWKQTMTLRDYERDRTIPVDLYWSRHQTQGPLIVISHGFGADRRFLGYLAYHIASYGFTVVALEHPGSNVAWLTGSAINQPSRSRASNILPASEFVDRPKDVSFL